MLLLIPSISSMLHPAIPRLTPHLHLRLNLPDRAGNHACSVLARAARVRAWNTDDDDEHDRFLDALLLFGRDWKRIQRFVATKTAIQIRRHAQKHFLKARKLGLAVGLPPPPLHPRRAALLQANAAAADMMPPPWLPSAGGGSNSIGCSAPPFGVQQSMSDWPPACYSSPDEASFRPLIHSSDDCSFIGTPNCSGSGEECLVMLPSSCRMKLFCSQFLQMTWDSLRCTSSSATCSAPASGGRWRRTCGGCRAWILPSRRRSY